MSLNGKRIVIIGGSSGIGLSIAKAVSLEGATTSIASRDKEKLHKAEEMVKRILFKAVRSLPIILLLFSFNLLTASTIVLHKASDNEKTELQKHLIYFYSQELLKAGLFTDKASALEAAKKEGVDASTLFYLIRNEYTDADFGYIAYSTDAMTAYIECVYLDEKYRGQGFGKQALYLLENRLREKGTDIIKLYVFAHNQAAFGLYKGMGYVIEKTYFNNKLLIGYHMKKEVQPTTE